ncbi:ArsR/SmtB family transcription factor [Caldisphaera sp.]|jgi:DNA-binding transcriptional ArsR family regulator|uniref:ArsR/SmtB family transcription factor n=1 Tax=Caldisphaera sp. TaxID=2060322 RepID=UPI003D09CCAF
MINMLTNKTNNEPLLSELVSFFTALSDRTRLEIVLFLIKKGEASVQDIANNLGKSQSLISHHLSCLKNCGVVNVDKKGKYSIYVISNKEVKEIIDLAINHVSSYSKSILSCDILREENSRK